MSVPQSSSSYTTDQKTAENVMRMLQYLFESLTSKPINEEVARNCGKAGWRQQLCHQYGIPSEDNNPPQGIGDDIAFYDTNGTGIARTAQAILNAFETNMPGGRPTTEIPRGQQLKELYSTRIFMAFLELLSDPVLGKEFIAGDADTRRALLTVALQGQPLDDQYGAMQELINSYQPASSNSQLAQRMQDMSETLYNQFQFVC